MSCRSNAVRAMASDRDLMSLVARRRPDIVISCAVSRKNERYKSPKLGLRRGTFLLRRISQKDQPGMRV